MSMYRTSAYLLFTLLCTGTVMAQGKLSSQELKAINSHVQDMIEVTPKAVTSAGLSKVFDGKVYDVKIGFKVGNGTSYQNVTLIQHKNQFIALDKSTSKLMPELLKMVKPGFKLKAPPQAKSFEEGLDALFPLGTFDKKHKKHFKKGNKWYFIRGEFFKDKSGFIVSTKAGKITEIKYELRIKDV